MADVESSQAPCDPADCGADKSPYRGTDRARKSPKEGTNFSPGQQPGTTACLSANNQSDSSAKFLSITRFGKHSAVFANWYTVHTHDDLHRLKEKDADHFVASGQRVVKHFYRYCSQ
jgi:hypothetical protein